MIMKKLTPRQDLAEHTRISKYARYKPQTKQYETFDEIIDRVMGMHRTMFPQLVATGDIDRVEKALRQKKILGSQRALQFGGAAILKKNVRIYNCSFTHFDNWNKIPQILWLSLCGCGYGVSLQRRHVNKLPALKKPRRKKEVFIIEDSIEGWADAAYALVSSYIDGSATLVFDYSKIRPFGSVISSSATVAPGPEPLKRSLERARGLLDAITARKNTKAKPIDVYDILTALLDCVIAGGVRRVAGIILFSRDDKEMLESKTGDWYVNHLPRRLANISAVMPRGEVTEAEFVDILQRTREFGEPGFFFCNDENDGTNACGEIGLRPFDEITQESGIAFCNLTTTNVASCATADDFYELAAGASILGTMQAAYVDLGYLNKFGDASRNVMARDALTGVSITGMAENPLISFDPDVLQRAAGVVVDENKRVAALLGIRPAARNTCVKPEGTASLLLACSNGIGAFKGRRMLRHVQAGHRDLPLNKWLKEHAPDMVIPSAYNPEEVTLAFPIEAPEGAALEGDFTAKESLERVLLVQKNWVIPGTTRDTHTHNVSNTVSVKNHEWQEVGKFLFSNKQHLSGVTLLSDVGDLAYAQSPFTVIRSDEELQKLKEEDVVQYERGLAAVELFDKLKNNWPVIPWHEFRDEENNESGTETAACGLDGTCHL